MSKTILVAAIAALSISAAKADTINMGSTDYWDFVANPDISYCMATTTYPSTGEMLRLGLGDQGFTMSFYSPKANYMREGENYNLPFRTSNGNSGVVVGHSLSNGQQLMIKGLTKRFMMSVARSYTITINDFGTFKLIGSSDAIKRLIECYSAIKPI